MRGSVGRILGWVMGEGGVDLNCIAEGREVKREEGMVGVGADCGVGLSDRGDGVRWSLFCVCHDRVHFLSVEEGFPERILILSVVDDVTDECLLGS